MVDEDEEEELVGDKEVDMIRMEREQMIVDVIETQKEKSAKMEHQKLQQQLKKIKKIVLEVGKIRKYNENFYCQQYHHFHHHQWHH